jgi:protease I
MRQGMMVVVLACLVASLASSCKEAGEFASKVTGKIRDKVTGTKANEPATMPETGVATAAPVTSGTVGLLLPHEGFEESEYKTTRTVLEEAGFDIRVISFFGDPARGALGAEVAVDVLLEDQVEKIDELVALVLIGGPGATFFHHEKKAHELVQVAVAAELVVGAICLAPYTLGYAGVLKGREATAWTAGDFTPEKLAGQGAFFRHDDVVVDGRLVTANGPSAATSFARALVATLKGD